MALKLEHTGLRSGQYMLQEIFKDFKLSWLREGHPRWTKLELQDWARAFAADPEGKAALVNLLHGEASSFDAKDFTNPYFYWMDSPCQTE